MVLDYLLIDETVDIHCRIFHTWRSELHILKIFQTPWNCAGSAIGGGGFEAARPTGDLPGKSTLHDSSMVVDVLYIYILYICITYI